MTQAPHNLQLMRAKRYWVDKEMKRNFNFQHLTDLSVKEVVALIPAEVTHEDKVFLKCQGIYRGIRERVQLAAGRGKRKDIKKKMAAKIALLLDDQYPLILSCTASWMGKISYLSVFDAKGDRKGRINIKVPFVPMRESSTPRKLRLSVTSAKEYIVDQVDDTEVVRHVLTFQFIDEITGEFMMRKLYMQYDLDGFDVSMYNRLAIIDEALTNSFLESPSSESGSSGFIRDYINGSSSSHKEVFDAPKAANVIYLGSESDSKEVITVTNIVAADLLRIGFRWKSKLYILRCSNELDITMINILDIGSDFQMVFLFRREFIGRSHDITTMWETLMGIAEKHPTIAPILSDQPVTEEMRSTANSATVEDGICCFVTYMRDEKVVSIALAREDGSPLFGSGFESLVQLESMDDLTDMRATAEALVGDKSITSLLFRNSYSDEFLRGNLTVIRDVSLPTEELLEEIPDADDTVVLIEDTASMIEPVQVEKVDTDENEITSDGQDSIVTVDEPTAEPVLGVIEPESEQGPEDASPEEDPFDGLAPKATDPSTADTAGTISKKDTSQRSVTFEDQFQQYSDVLASKEEIPLDSVVEESKAIVEAPPPDTAKFEETEQLDSEITAAPHQIDTVDEAVQDPLIDDREDTASSMEMVPVAEIADPVEEAVIPPEEEIKFLSEASTSFIVDSAIAAEDLIDSSKVELKSEPDVNDILDEEATESCIVEMTETILVEVAKSTASSVIEEIELYESIRDVLESLLQNICDKVLQDLAAAKEAFEQAAMFDEEMKGKEYQRYEKEETARRKLLEVAEEKRRLQEEARNRVLEEEREKRRKEAEAKQKEKEELRRVEEEFIRKKAELASVPYTVTKIKSGVDRTAASNYKRDVFTPTLQKSIKRQPLSLFSPQKDDEKVHLPAYAYESAEGLKKALQSDDLSVAYSIGNSSNSVDEFSPSGLARSQSTVKISKKREGHDSSLKPIKVMKSERNKFRERLLKKSLEGFTTLGYVDKQPLVYATHWNKKVAEFLQSLSSIKELRKRLSTLQRTSPIELTTEERICALADTAGNTGEVIEKVKNLEYCSELKLASSAVDLRNLLSYFPGGSDILSASIAAGANVDLSGYSSDEVDSLDGTTVSGFTQYCPSSVAGSTGNYGLNYDLIKPTDASRQRMRYMESHSPMLPHLDISKGSPFVQSRANFFVTNKPQGGGSSSSSSSSSKLRSATSDAAFNPGYSESILSTTTPAKPSTTAAAINYKDTSETIGRRLRNTIGIEVEESNDDSSVSVSIEDGQQSTSKRRAAKEKISTPAMVENHNPFEKKIFQRLNAGGDANSLISEDYGSVGSLNTVGTQKSHRFYAQFNALLDEMHTGEAVAMVTRKQANFAQRDETLLKSDKYYIREFVEQRAARLLQQKALLNQTF